MENIKELFADFKAKTDEYVKVCKDMRNNSERLLRTLIEKNGGDIDRESELLDGVYVAYDGGNHPEYASCVACSVMRIYIGDDDKVYFDLEDEPEYCIDRVNEGDLVWSCYDIINNYNEIEKNGKD